MPSGERKFNDLVKIYNIYIFYLMKDKKKKKKKNVTGEKFERGLIKRTQATQLLKRL